MKRLNAATVLVDANGAPTPPFRDYLTRLENNLPILGDGSPEGVVEADLYSLYINRTGAPIEYRKMSTDIGGDKTQGWLAV